ncbi:MAG: lipid-A-disaccharide synthase [Thermodesulfobacteriota bacterium]
MLVREQRDLEIKKKKILIIAGEASGDLHGSKLVSALLSLQPELEIYAVGSELMRQAGAKVLIDSATLAVVGITEVFGQLPNIFKAYRALKKFIREENLSLLVLIDFPDFNLRLAKVAHRQKIPILYYISPQVWAWRKGRVQKIANLVNKMAVILPFEVDLYKEAGLEVEFVGHPLLDVISYGQEDLWEEGGKIEKGNPCIALLPGSRLKEVKSLLPAMLEAAKIILAKKSTAKFILPIAPSIPRTEIEKILPASLEVPLIITENQAYWAMATADLIIVASGTATLEAAIFQKPMIIVYQVSFLSYIIGKALIKVRWVGLVNIIAGKKIVPELLQGDVQGDLIAAEALKILEDETYRKEMLINLAEVRKKLGAPGAAGRVAQLALRMMGN